MLASRVMHRARELTEPFQADSSQPSVRPWLRPFHVIDRDGVSFTLQTDVLERLAESQTRESGHPLHSFTILGVLSECNRVTLGRPMYLAHLLAAGVLGIPLPEVGKTLAWHERYLSAREGEPPPTPTLDELLLAWRADVPDAIGGVIGSSGRLCWWEAEVRPGVVTVRHLALQELDAFTRDGAPERVETVSVDREVEPDVRRRIGR